MRSKVLIEKRDAGYSATFFDRYGGEHSGVLCAMTPHEVAMRALQWMLEFVLRNPEGGDLVAPPEVLELVPEHLRSVPQAGI